MICLNVKKIIQLRHEKGMTQQALADETGLTRKMIERIETRRVKSPHFCNVVAICRVLRLDMNELIEEKRKTVCCD